MEAKCCLLLCNNLVSLLQAHWGMIMIYRGVTLPAISIKHLVLQTPESRKTCKQWKDVPFLVEPFNYNRYNEDHLSDTEDE